MTPPVGPSRLNHTGLNPAVSTQVVPVLWRGGAAISLPAEPDPILAACCSRNSPNMPTPGRTGIPGQQRRPAPSAPAARSLPSRCAPPRGWSKATGRRHGWPACSCTSGCDPRPPGGAGARGLGPGVTAATTVLRDPVPVIQDRGDLRGRPARQYRPQRGRLGEQLRMGADHAGVGPGRRLRASSPPLRQARSQRSIVPRE
jgi:hypothetical protein